MILFFLILQIDIENPYISERENINYEDSLVIKEDWYDSTFITVKEVYSLDDYFDKKMKDLLQKSLKEGVEDFLNSRSENYSGDELIKEIEIPTLLGGESNIDIDGGDNITVGGSQTITSDQEKKKVLPELKIEQNLNVLVNAQIETKIHAQIDYNTQRWTDAENTVKLWYEGDEDEIVKKLEFGNTSLELPRSAGYISQIPVSQGLFGVSGHYQLGSADIRSILTYEQSNVQTKEFKGGVESHVDTIYDYSFIAGRFFFIPETDSITDIYVYVHKSYMEEPLYDAIATVLVDYPDSTPDYAWDRVSGRFEKLEKNKDYFFDNRNNILELSSFQSLSSGEALGVWYVRASGDTVGGYLHNDSLVLRLLWSSLPDTTSSTWDLQLRNIYSVFSSGETSINVKILRDEAGREDIEYETDGEYKGQVFSQILGIDPNGDGEVEYPQYDPDRGILIFPDLQPFASDKLSVKDSIIYKKEDLQEGEGGKYYIVVESQSAITRYSLSPGIKENSEKVYLNGSEQSRGTDYTIDYSSGDLSFKKPVSPNAEIRVTYELDPLFMQSEKYSLVGASMELPIGGEENNKFILGAYHRAMSVSDRNVSIDRVPFSRTVMEGSIVYSKNIDFLDRITKKMRSRKKSSFTLTSSGAVSIPNPNTRGIAYIENFEGTGSSPGPSISKYSWHYTSLPLSKDTASFSKNRLIWFDDDIKKEDIFGADVVSGSYNQTKIMKIVYSPEDGTKWSGLMTAMSNSNLEYAEEVEIIMKTTSNEGTFHLSVGTSIDEDQLILKRDGGLFGVGEYNTEDANKDGKLDLSEDVGIDGIEGSDDQWPDIEGDLGNDDYNADNNPNGTENNQRLDREDIDGSGSFTNYNDYYEYTFTLRDDNVKDLQNGWKIIKINLKDTTLYEQFGSPQWNNIKFVRLWFEGINSTDTIMLYSIDFPQLDWKEIQVIDYNNTGEPIDSTETVKIGTVNRETDPDYTSPFPVSKDPTTGQSEIENSMKVEFSNIKEGHGVLIGRYSYNKYDLRDYKKVNFYIHSPDENIGVFIRLGTDSVSYYEYSLSLVNAEKSTYGDGKWYKVSFYIDSLALFKYNTEDRTTRIKEGNFAVMGDPTFSEIQYLTVGLWNETNSLISEEVWFDDIRVSEPRKGVGYAVKSNAKFNIGDVAQISFDVSKETGNFVNFIEDQFVKTTGDEWRYNFNSQLNIDKFLPQKLRLNIPFVYNISEQYSSSRYSMDANDVFSDITGEKLPNRTKSEGVSVNLSRSSFGKEPWFLKYLVNAIKMDGAYSTSYNISTVNRSKDTSYSYKGSVRYGVNPDLNIKLKNKYIDILPYTINANLSRTFDERISYEMTDSTDILLSDIRNNYITVGSGFSHRLYMLTTTYNFSQARDADVENKISNINIGEETGRSQSLNENLTVPIIGIITPSLSASGSYGEDFPKEMRGDSNYRNVHNNGSITFSTGRLYMTKVWDQVIKEDSTHKSPKILKSLKNLTDKINFPIFTYVKSRTTSYTYIKTRPDLDYQFGLSDTLTGISSQTVLSKTTRDSIGLDGGINPFSNISINMQYGHGYTEFYQWGGSTFSDNTTFPSINFNWNNIEKNLKKIFNSASFSLSFYNTISKSGDVGKEPTSIGYSQGIRPYFALSWVNSLNTNIGLNGTRTLTESYDITGTTRQENRDLSGDLNLTYSIKPGKGFIQEKLKLKKPLILNFTSNVSLSQQIITKENSESIISKDDIISNFTFSTSYRFPGGVTGSFNTGYSNNYNRKSGFSSQNISVNFTASFNF